MSKIYAYIGVCLIFCLSIGRLAAEEKIRACAAIPPIQWMVEQIGGESVDAWTLLPEGKGPHVYQPRPSDMKKLHKTDLYFKVGLPFENKIIERIRDSYPDLRIISVSDGIAMIRSEHLEDREDSEDRREHDARHIHGEYDPHIWLDPLRALVIAENIRDVLIGTKPEMSANYRTNYQDLKAHLLGLHELFKVWFEPVTDRTFYVYHPAFRYLADRYHLHEVALEKEGKSPGPQYLAQLMKEAKHAAVIFRQPQFPEESVRNLADELDAEIQVVNPLAYHYLDNMKSIGAKIMMALQLHKQNEAKGTDLF